MTREEAIRELKQFSGTTRLRLSANFWEALNRAIKALEKEPYEDAISRSAVLNTLDKMDSVLDEGRTVETYKELLTACYKDLPSVTPTKCIAKVSFSKEDMRELIDEKMKEIVVERKKGHWIEGQTDNPKIHNILCSCCFEGYPSKGHANSQYTKKKFQYCPNCGAEMEGEE